MVTFYLQTFMKTSQIVFVYLETFVFAYASGLRKTKPIGESDRKTHNTL